MGEGRASLGRTPNALATLERDTAGSHYRETGNFLIIFGWRLASRIAARSVPVPTSPPKVSRAIDYHSVSFLNFLSTAALKRIVFGAKLSRPSAIALIPASSIVPTRRCACTAFSAMRSASDTSQ
jgi:hypothetical protein